MRRGRAGVLAILLAVCGVAEGQQPDITLDPEGRYVDAKLGRIVDVGSGSPAAVNVPVPEEYLAKARAELAGHTCVAGREHVFMYRYYDPARPAEVLMSPY
jgi:hypothetical protein